MTRPEQRLFFGRMKSVFAVIVQAQVAIVVNRRGVGVILSSRMLVAWIKLMTFTATYTL
jgi:hypothetical protein